MIKGYKTYWNLIKKTLEAKMFKKNSLSTPEMFKLNSNFYLDQGFFEKESHFEKSEISNFEVTIFLSRLIGVFDILMTKLEFAVNPCTVFLKPCKIYYNLFVFLGNFTIYPFTSKSPWDFKNRRFEANRVCVCSVFIFLEQFWRYSIFTLVFWIIFIL